MSRARPEREALDPLHGVRRRGVGAARLPGDGRPPLHAAPERGGHDQLRRRQPVRPDPGRVRGRFEPVVAPWGHAGGRAARGPGSERGLASARCAAPSSAPTIFPLPGPAFRRSPSSRATTSWAGPRTTPRRCRRTTPPSGIIGPRMSSAPGTRWTARSRRLAWASGRSSTLRTPPVNRPGTWTPTSGPPAKRRNRSPADEVVSQHSVATDATVRQSGDTEPTEASTDDML